MYSITLKIVCMKIGHLKRKKNKNRVCSFVPFTLNTVLFKKLDAF